MAGLFRIFARPKLKSPVLLASWPGVGNVSMIVATYLKKKLELKSLAEVEPAYFFDPIGVVVRDNIVEAPQFPENRFYYWKNKAGSNDLILFIGEDQPVANSYELANCILDVADRYGVKQVYTCAAALSHIHHTEQPRAWGVGTNQEMAQLLREHELVQKGNLQISGLNGLLLGVAKERSIDGICLLGQVPMHTTRIPNPMASLAILRELTKMLGIEIDLTELNDMANETAATMKEIAAEVMGEYIDRFTQPIWEQEEEDEEE